METPEWDELLEEVLRANRDGLETAMPGRVVSFDAARNTVSVQPQFRRQLPNQDGTVDEEDLPVLQDVPIGWMSGMGGTCYLTFPLQAGDTGMLCFAARDLGPWRSAGEAIAGGDQRRHGLGGAWFVPALRPIAGALAAAKRHASKVVIGDSVMLGAGDLNEITMGALNGEAVDAYTTMTQYQLGNASSVIFVKKS